MFEGMLGRKVKIVWMDGGVNKAVVGILKDYQSPWLLVESCGRTVIITENALQTITEMS